MSQSDFKQTISSNYLRKYLLIIFLSCFFSLSASDYEIYDLGTLALFQGSHPIDLNDNGQVLLSLDSSNSEEKLALWDIRSGLQFLPTKKGDRLSLKRMNNNGWIIGKAHIYDDSEDRDGWIDCPVVWNQDLKIFEYIKGFNRNADFKDINDKNQIIGVYQNEDHQSRIFIYENKKVEELNIDKEIASLGYYPLGYSVFKINNRGEILGEFTYGEKHPFKDKWREVGKHYFLWDGHVRIIDLPEEPISYHNRPTVYLNDLGEVLIFSNTNNNKSFWIWDKNKGIKKHNLKDLSLSFPGINEDFFDSIKNICKGNTIYISQRHRLFDHIDISKYSGLEISNIIRINSRGQMLIDGRFWNEIHAFLINPISGRGCEKS